MLLLTLFATDQATMEWVQRVHHAITPGEQADLFTPFELYATGPATVVIVALIYVLDRHRRARAFALVLILGIVSVTNYPIKMLVGRERPATEERAVGSFKTVFGGPGEGFRSVGYRSFPSGHAVAAVSQSVVLAAFYPSAAPLLYGLAILTAAARVYHGAHYLSDVAAAALLAYVMSRWLLRHPTLQRLCLSLADRSRFRDQGSHGEPAKPPPASLSRPTA